MNQYYNGRSLEMTEVIRGEDRAILALWQDSLRRLLVFYETKRGSLLTFFPKLFLFFIFLNISCYWLAMFTAFPDLIFGDAGSHYFMVQFPVGFLGALFDSMSFFITLFIIRSALQTQNLLKYISHLSLDFVIAVLATLWVVFVFSVSGWIITLYEVQLLKYTKKPDISQNKWQLSLFEGSEAFLKSSPEYPEKLRVDINKADSDTAWHIYVDKRPIALAKGQTYIVSFRARAKSPRSMEYGVGQAHEPWHQLGLYRQIELSREWQDFQNEFSASGTDANARLHFDMGGNENSVELSDIRFQLGEKKSLVHRNKQYEKLLVDAVNKPTKNKRNIYFGLIMGISASFPTCIHILMFVNSLWHGCVGRKKHFKEVNG